MICFYPTATNHLEYYSSRGLYYYYYYYYYYYTMMPDDDPKPNYFGQMKKDAKLFDAMDARETQEKEEEER